MFVRVVASVLILAALSAGRARADEAGLSLEAQKLQNACATGNSASCIHLGILYRRGVGAPMDPRKALELFVGACEQGVTLGCAFTGDMAYLGSGVAPAPAHGVVLMRNACEKKNEWACETLRRYGLITRDPHVMY